MIRIELPELSARGNYPIGIPGEPLQPGDGASILPACLVEILLDESPASKN
jgi:hypothetical protein